MTESRAGDELFLISMLRNPVATLDSALRTGAAIVPAVLDALRAVPRLADAMEKLTPALQAAQGSLDRIDRLVTFVGQEVPETQLQLEELRKQLIAATAVNRALNESVRLLSRGLSAMQGATDLFGRVLGPRKAP
ncbi:MAG TPA: hypothetical protein VFV67_19555 [Actinophytocola sp.]|uniref:hypothetical protein n=1 Tax=Actinophytocola sp. TaxID=1872138 RepID=UPI002DB809D9|nr:hypothetical protein [Actinophytocola sp.]HEU5472849.1 hypothetical protein [Actinophytocola sp.]